MHAGRAGIDLEFSRVDLALLWLACCVILKTINLGTSRVMLGTRQLKYAVHWMAFRGEYFVGRYGMDAARKAPPIQWMLIQSEMGRMQLVSRASVSSEVLTA